MDHLAVGRQVLGVVISGIGQSGGSRILQGVAHQASSYGCPILLHGVDSFAHNDMHAVLRELLRYKVGGIVCAVSQEADNNRWIEDDLSYVDVPIVFVNAAPCRLPRHVVSFNNYQGARMATHYLLSKNYQRIAHVSGPLGWWEAAERKRGWQDEMASSGYEDVLRLHVEGDWSPASGRAALRRLLEENPDVDAVFAGNDHMALGVIQMAHELGLRIPEQLGLIGFDNLLESAFFDPPLTTIENDKVALGELAMQTLLCQVNPCDAHLALMEELSERQRPMLVVRSSC